MKNKISILEIKNFLKKNKLVISKKKKEIQTISILEIKNFIKKSGFVINKKKNKKQERSFGSLAQTLITSIIIISIFSITPLVIDIKKKDMFCDQNNR